MTVTLSRSLPDIPSLSKCDDFRMKRRYLRWHYGHGIHLVNSEKTWSTCCAANTPRPIAMRAKATLDMAYGDNYQEHPENTTHI